QAVNANAGHYHFTWVWVPVFQVEEYIHAYRDLGLTLQSGFTATPSLC
ncbi:hypothetical protein MGSAQ_000282, partial [marine sediment metagenome]